MVFHVFLKIYRDKRILTTKISVFVPIRVKSRPGIAASISNDK